MESNIDLKGLEWILTQSTLIKIKKIDRLLTNQYNFILKDNCGITVGQLYMMLAIAQNPINSPTVLANKLGIDRTTVTRNFKGLQRKALADVGGIPIKKLDNRHIAYQLTKKGMRVLIEAINEYVKLNKNTEDNLGTDDLPNLLKILDSLEKRTKEMECY